jgi:hypothetical protein
LLVVLLAAGLAVLADFGLPEVSSAAGFRVRPLVSVESDTLSSDASSAFERGLRGVAGGSILRFPFRIH